MRKILFILVSAILLAACGTETEEKDVASVDTNDHEVLEEKDVENNDEAPVENDKIEMKETLVDNDNFHVVLTGVEKVIDKDWDEEYYEIKMTVQNKMAQSFEIQSHEVSADDVMIDDLVFFSETVSSGKTANVTMKIQNYDGDLPEIQDNLEFDLSIFTLDEPYHDEKEHVKINF